MRVALVHNPAGPAGRLRRIAALAQALAARGHRVTHHDSMAFDWWRDAPESELICVCGGDGTARLVVGAQGQPEALPALAVFPAGTINLLARELSYPADPAAFVHRIEQEREVVSPLATLNGSPFLACVSIGVDALAVASLSTAAKARVGRLAYVGAMAPLLARWPRHHQLTVRTAAETFPAEAVFVQRARFYAGPWRLHPDARLGHDDLRVLALPRARRRDVATLAARALAGVVAPHPAWRYLEAQTIEVTSDEAVPVQADGDPADALPARIAMTGASLRFR